MRNAIYLIPLLLLALLAFADGEWYKVDHPDLLIPFEESIGVGSSSSLPYREGDLYVNRVSGAKVFMATPWASLPDLASASDWLKKPSIIYGATDGISQWWGVEDNPLRYIPFAGTSNIISPTEIVSVTMTANYFSTNILNATTINVNNIIIQGTPFSTPTPMPENMVIGAHVTPIATYQFNVDYPTPLPTPTPWNIHGSGIATVTPASATEWIISVEEPTPAKTSTPMPTATPPHALETRVAQLEIQPATSTTIIYQDLGGGIIGFEEHFTEPHTTWTVPLPPGKRLVEGAKGTSFAFMDDLSVWWNHKVIPGPGATQVALWFPFTGMGVGAEFYGHGQFMLEDFDGYAMGQEERMTTPMTTVMESFVGSVVLFP